MTKDEAKSVKIGDVVYEEDEEPTAKAILKGYEPTPLLEAVVTKVTPDGVELLWENGKVTSHSLDDLEGQGIELGHSRRHNACSPKRGEMKQE